MINYLALDICGAFMETLNYSIKRHETYLVLKIGFTLFSGILVSSLNFVGLSRFLCKLISKQSP